MATAMEEIPVRPGDLLGGKYRVTRLIGRGGMGVVVEAVHVELHERVAIKVLHERYLDNDEAVARFQHEARAAVRIRGEHSARLIDVGTAANRSPFIVMEYLEGFDFATMIRSGAIPIEDACLYILQACQGIAEVHANGIIHRDLKPGNLFLTHRPDGSPLVKVLDFGIAKSAVPMDEAERAITMTLVSMGTPSYMSPEQVRSSRSVDSRADVWSLGAILYELLAGVPAFGGNSVAHITAQVLEAQPPSLLELRKEITPELDRVVRKALSKHPDGRYSDVAALATALEPFAGPRGEGHARRASSILRGQDSLVHSFPNLLRAANDDDAPTDFGTHIYRRGSRERWIKLAIVGLSTLAVVILGLVGLAWRERTASAGMAVAIKGVRGTFMYQSGIMAAQSRMSKEAPADPPTAESASASAAPPPSTTARRGVGPPPPRATPATPPPAPAGDDYMLENRK